MKLGTGIDWYPQITRTLAHIVPKNYRSNYEPLKNGALDSILIYDTITEEMMSRLTDEDIAKIESSDQINGQQEILRQLIKEGNAKEIYSTICSKNNDPGMDFLRGNN